MKLCERNMNRVSGMKEARRWLGAIQKVARPKEHVVAHEVVNNTFTKSGPINFGTDI